MNQWIHRTHRVLPSDPTSVKGKYSSWTFSAQGMDGSCKTAVFETFSVHVNAQFWQFPDPPEGMEDGVVLKQR